MRSSFLEQIVAPRFMYDRTDVRIRQERCRPAGTYLNGGSADWAYPRLNPLSARLWTDLVEKDLVEASSMREPNDPGHVMGVK
jgi:hypothetical protein